MQPQEAQQAQILVAFVQGKKNLRDAVHTLSFGALPLASRILESFSQANLSCTALESRHD